MFIEDLFIDYINTGNIPVADYFYFNETRDQSQSRISGWIKTFQAHKVNINDSIILGAILGELTNNSFDHNLGYWKDKPGCLVGFYFEKDYLKIIIADRGQGIISSLKSVIPEKISNHEILEKAFLEKISGRAPEKRGNGLKFVLKHIKESGSSLFCQSEGEIFKMSVTHFSPSPLSSPNENLPKNFSTFTIIEWKIK